MRTADLDEWVWKWSVGGLLPPGDRDHLVPVSPQRTGGVQAWCNGVGHGLQ